MIRKPQSPAELIGETLLFQLLLYTLRAPLLSATADCSPFASRLLSALTGAAVFILPTLAYLRASRSSLGDLLHPLDANNADARAPKASTPTSEKERKDSGAKSSARAPIGADGSKLVRAVLAALLVIDAVELADTLSNALLSAVGVQRAESAFATDTPTVILSFVSSVLLTPMLEEMLFRGAVIKAYAPYGARAAISVSAISFALMHYSVYSLLYALCAGALIAYFTVRTNSLAFGIWLHAANNAAAFAFSLLKSVRPELYTRASAVFLAVTLPISVVYAVMLVRRELKGAPKKRRRTSPPSRSPSASPSTTSPSLSSTSPPTPTSPSSLASSSPIPSSQPSQRPPLPSPISPELIIYAILAAILAVWM